MGGNETRMSPIINLSDKSLKPNTKLWNSTRDSVREAMEHHGWFVVEYNNFPTELHRSILDVAKGTTRSSSPSQKLKNENPKVGHGYITMISDDQPVHEGLGIDQVNHIQQCRRFSSLMWPDNQQDNDRFCETVYAYAKMQEELEQLVIRMLFESYNLDKYAEKHIGETRYLLRLLKYRRLPNGEPNRKFVSHTDKSFISILHQNHIKGLMLKSEKDDAWYPFTPSPTRFAVITGDAIMAWSNDNIKSCYDKVEMKSVEERYSLGFFSFQEGIISILEEMVDKDYPLAYKPFQHDRFLDFYETLEVHLKIHRIMTKTYCGIPQTCE